MVNFYQADKKGSAPQAIEVTCQSLDILGRGVCKQEGRVYFVPDLLPQEVARVMPQVSAAGAATAAADSSTVNAKVTKYLQTSPERRLDSCPLQQQCGGCPLAHMPPSMALEAKVAGVAKLLTKTVFQGTRAALAPVASKAHGTSKLGKNSTIKQALALKRAQAKNQAHEKELQAQAQAAAMQVAKPDFVLSSPELAYRRACRLAVRADHGRYYVGFREGKTQDLVKVSSCGVLTPRLNALLEPVQQLINTLDGKKELGHVELLDSAGAVDVLLRLTKKVGEADLARLQEFAAQEQVVLSLVEPFKQLDDSEVVRERVVYDGGVVAAAEAETEAVHAPMAAPAEEQSEASNVVQTEAEAEVKAVATAANAAASATKWPVSPLLYVESGDCRIYCSPASFVQVNASMNQQMVQKVLEVVAPHEGQKVLDLFSGLGNFALPIAKGGSQVVGIEIVSEMVRGAQYNAQYNGVAERARFYVADLAEPFETQLWAKEHYDVVVMDPGRMGAERAVRHVAKLQPQQIVIISCNPLAAMRDLTPLLAAHYKIQSWGALDMFPRTSHIEIMFVLTREMAKA